MSGRRHTWAIAAIACMLGLLVGASGSLVLQGPGAAAARPDPATAPAQPGEIPTVPAAGGQRSSTSALPAELSFAWTSGGLPAGFEERARDSRVLEAVAVVHSDTAWIGRTFDADGRLVDDPREPFDIPIEASSVDPASFGAFLPLAYRPVVGRLQDGEGVISESSAKVRRLGVGGTIEMRTAPGQGRVPIRIAAVLPDDLVGATELMVAHDVGRGIGVEVPRYALLDAAGSRSLAGVTRAVRAIVGPGTPLQVRAFGDTLYPRHGDAVLPPVLLKLRFGEFAARPRPSAPGYLQIDGRWTKEHIRTLKGLPIVGNVQCHRDLLPQLLGALQELRRRGLQDLIRTEHGCFAPRFMLRVPNSALSHHSWGIAIDVNLAGNEFGATPHQPRALVRIMEKWGFTWGGTWITPDGNHFEWHHDVDAATR